MSPSEPQAAPDPTQANAEPPQEKDASSQAMVVRWWRDYPLLIFFMLVWVAPMFWMGATKNQRLSYIVATKLEKELKGKVNLRTPILPVKLQEKFLPKDPLLNRVRPITWYDAIRLPREVTHLHNASCLFTKRVSRWASNHVQGTIDGKRWFTLRDDLYSPAKPFGHRARVDRFLSDIGAWKRRSSVYVRQADEMCEWYRNHYTKTNPFAPPLVAVRLVNVNYIVGDPVIAEPEGRWIKRIPEHLPNKPVQVIHVKQFVNNPIAQRTSRQVEFARANIESEIKQDAKGEPCCPGL